VAGVLSLTCGFLGIIGLPIAVLIAAGGGPLAGVALVVASLCAVALAVWLARTGREGEDEVSASLDWEAFDRDRERWERSHQD
jgi:cyanate permease